MIGAGVRSAEIIAVGSELLGADRTDTNSLFITQCLNDLGVEVRAKAVVGDRLEDLVAVCRDALRRADVVVLTGGLGPTDDDLTRDAVALVAGRALSEDAPTVERIRARFARRGIEMPALNRRQALVIDGAVLVENPHGTAPAQWLEIDGRLVTLLPGPPREMRPLFERISREVIGPRTGGERIWRRSIRLAGRAESQAEEVLQPLYHAWSLREPPLSATILAAGGTLELQLRARAREAQAAESALEQAAQDVLDRFGPDVADLRGEPLEVAVGNLLRGRGLMLAVAESCTGGLVGSRLTDVAGSSAYVERAVVAYSNRAKTELLDVPEDVIARHGAVSEPVALAMASGIRRRAGVDVAVAITGIAGPGGGSDAKPVGTVVVAVDGPGDARVVRTFAFAGDRALIKLFASTAALDRLRRALLAG
jgi:nicotinamide-nucleotide amidase